MGRRNTVGIYGTVVSDLYPVIDSLKPKCRFPTESFWRPATHKLTFQTRVARAAPCGSKVQRFGNHSHDDLVIAVQNRRQGIIGNVVQHICALDVFRSEGFTAPYCEDRK